MAKEYTFRISLQQAERTSDGRSYSVVYGGSATRYREEQFTGTLVAAIARRDELSAQESRCHQASIGMANRSDRSPPGLKASAYKMHDEKAKTEDSQQPSRYHPRDTYEKHPYSTEPEALCRKCGARYHDHYNGKCPWTDQNREDYTPPTLSQIIKANAERMAEVSVHVVSIMGHVTISAPGKEDIFLDGDDAATFISEGRRLYNETGDCTQSEVWEHLAAPYAENLWN